MRYRIVDAEMRAESSLAIYAVEGVTQDNKTARLKQLLQQSGFFSLLKQYKLNTFILIKCNFTPASQVAYHYYTDPALVNALLELIEGLGYSNVFLAESETHFADAFPEMKPPRQAKVLGFKGNVINLTDTEKTRFTYNKGEIELSNKMIEAATSGFLINFSKAKNHEVYGYTAALKNIYGSIPARNKFTLFHQRKSGLDVPDATYFANITTKPHFHVIDFIEGVDGDEKALFYNPITDFKYYPAGMIVAGRDNLALDKFIATKMGYDPSDNPITKYYIDHAGDVDLTKVPIFGSDLTPLKGWRKVSFFWRLHGRFEHRLPVGEKTIAWGIRRYYFDTVPKNNPIPAIKKMFDSFERFPTRFFKSKEYIGIAKDYPLLKSFGNQDVKTIKISKFRGRPYNRFEYDKIIEYTPEVWEKLLNWLKADAAKYHMNLILYQDTAAYLGIIWEHQPKESK